jgi:hypothetical protein
VEADDGKVGEINDTMAVLVAPALGDPRDGITGGQW